jgi:signal transduction histidine kinase
MFLAVPRAASVVRRLALRLLTLAALLLALAAPAHAQIVLDRAQVLEGSSPSASGAWQSRSLPLRWTSTAEEPRELWVRSGFELPEPPREAWSLLVPRLPTGGEITLNGHRVTELPQESSAAHVRWRRPHLVHLPPEFLRAGTNEIQLHARFGAGLHGLSPPVVGPTSELSRAYTREYFLNHTLRWISALLVLLAALGFAALWWRRRDDAIYGLLALAAAFWSLRNADFAFEAVPQHMVAWTRSAYFLGSGAFAALGSIAALRWSGFRRPWIEAAMVGLGLAGALIYWVGGEPLALTLGFAWQAALLAMVAACTVIGVVTAFRRGGAIVEAIAVAVLIALAAAIHDFLVLIGWLPYDQPPLLNLATPLLLFAVAAALIDRFVTSLADVERINLELESRIQERERLLKRNFERVRDSERIKAGAQERQRIMQDMHDGLGSQLLSSLMLVERGAITKDDVAQVLRESIDDMRLAIDTLATEDADLLAALGNLRWRMEPRLKAAGIELQWDARDLPAELEVVSDSVLPILRIVQEALTNTIKHSHASVVRVTLAAEHDGAAQWLAIRVADNGRGLPQESSRGRGLANMRTRAGRIKANFSVESVPGGGTVVAVRYKLEPPARGPSTRTLPLSIGE